MLPARPTYGHYTSSLCAIPLSAFDIFAKDILLIIFKPVTYIIYSGLNIIFITRQRVLFSAPPPQDILAPAPRCVTDDFSYATHQYAAAITGDSATSPSHAISGGLAGFRAIRCGTISLTRHRDFIFAEAGRHSGRPIYAADAPRLHAANIDGIDAEKPFETCSAGRRRPFTTGMAILYHFRRAA